MRARRTTGALGAAAIAAMVLAGCGSDDDLPGEDTKNDSDSQGRVGSDRDLTAEDLDVSWQDALGTAQDAFDGRPTSIELSWETNEWAYSIELVSDTEEYEAEISASSGEVVSESSDRLDDDDAAEAESEVIDTEGLVDVDDAIQAAVDEVDGRVTEWKLDGSPRGEFFEIDVAPGDSGDDVEVTVDARSGEVVDVGD